MPSGKDELPVANRSCDQPLFCGPRFAQVLGEIQRLEVTLSQIADRLDSITEYPGKLSELHEKANHAVDSAAAAHKRIDELNERMQSAGTESNKALLRDWRLWLILGAAIGPDGLQVLIRAFGGG